MKRLILILLLVCFFAISVSANGDIKEEIINDLELNKAAELVPDILRDNSEVNFDPTAIPSKNGMNAKDIFNYVIRFAFKGVGEEVSFILFVIAVFVITSMIKGFIKGKGGLETAVHFSVSIVICSLFITHVNDALSDADTYARELSVFVKGLLPFMGSLSLMGGQVSSFAVMQALILSAVAFLQTVLAGVAMPVLKIILSFSLIGYITKLPLGALSDFLTAFTTKIITISFGILCAVIYFQNAVSSVTDSLALRSVKLAAGSFIPIVGGFVSEASGTLISGLNLVRSTFGVFAICVIFYVGVIPLINFGIKKLAFKFISVIARMLNLDNEAKVVGEIVGAYNILSAIMVASLCFFIFAVSVFIKSEVG